MKQIVPFTRKISFDTSVDEITSISLDKTIKNIEDSIISGVFDLYLEYKESDISVSTLKYTSTIPFDIDVDSKYSLKNVKVDIDDFYYEIEDDDVVLHIDLLVDNLEYAEEELENIITKHEDRKDDELETFDEEEGIDDKEDAKLEEGDRKKEDINSVEKEDVKLEVVDRKIDEIKPADKEEKEDKTVNKEEDLKKVDEEVVKTKEERDDSQIKIEDLFKELDEKIVDVKTSPKVPIFETFDPKNETYVTYNVHIVREEDNIETICTKYGVTKEELSYYNDISIIKLGDKLIVPTYKK